MALQLGGAKPATVSIGGSTGVRSSAPVARTPVSRTPVAVPTPTKTITFKTGTVAKPSQSITIAPKASSVIQSTVSKPKTTLTPQKNLKPLANATPKPSTSPIVKADPVLSAAVAASNTRTVISPTTNLKPISIATSKPQNLTTFTPTPVISKTLSDVLAESKTSIPTPSQNSLLNVPALNIPTLAPNINDMVSKIANIANGAAANIASRTESNWEDTVKLADKLNINEKINALVTKALSGENASANFNQLLAPQLSSLAAVSKASVGVVTSKAAIAQSRNNATAANALKSIAGLVTAGMKKVSDTDAANDLKSAATLGTDHVIGLKNAADSTIKQDQANIVSVIGNAVKNSAITAFNTRQAINNDKTKLHIMSSDYVKPLAPGTKSPQQMVDEANAANPSQSSSLPEKISIPGQGTIDTTVKSITDIGKSDESKPVVKKSSSSSSSSKPTETQAEKDARTVAEAREAGALDDKPSTSASTLSAVANLINAAKNPFGKPISAVAPVTKIISFTPKGMTNVKGSDGQRSVKIDTTFYTALKQTYKDDQIADLLSDPRLGVYVDKNSSAKIGPVANNPSDTYSETSGLYKVDPYKAVTDKSGNFVGVPEYTYYKLQKLGIPDSEMATIPKEVLKQMGSLDTGSMTGTSSIIALPTTAQEALQLPGERQISSGLFAEVPLTAAQRQANIDATPNPTEDPWGYLLSSAVQKGEDIYTYLAKPEYKNGYKIEPTVAGLLTFNKIANDLAKPGATIEDVKATGGLSSYEVFSSAMVNANPVTLANIAKNNPRVLLGASVDNSLQNILEAKMGNTYWNAISSAMTPKEYTEFQTRVQESPIEKPMGDILKAHVETGADLATMPDLVPYATGQITQLGKDLIISPVTPNVGVNALLAPILMIGKAPITIAKSGAKVGEKAALLTFVKTAQGMNAIRDGKIIGNLVGDVKDPSKFVINGIDGSKIDVIVKGNDVVATEVKAASSTIPSQQLKLSESANAKIITSTPSTDKKVAVMGADGKMQLKSAKDVSVSDRLPTSEEMTNAINQGFILPDRPAIESVFTTPISGPNASKYGIKNQISDRVYVTSDGNKMLRVGQDSFVNVSDDYTYKPGDTWSISTYDDKSIPSAIKITSNGKAVFHVAYDELDEAGNFVAKRIAKSPEVPTETKITDADVQAIAQADFDARAAAKSGEPTLASETDEWASETGMSESGGGGGESSSGGSGAVGGTPATDYSKWTMNSDWGAEIRSLDGGKTWQVKDPETGAIMSTKEYENLLTTRAEERRAIYDAATNTYTKLTKNPTTGKYDVKMYQDSAGGWVTKSQLDTERAAIAANNPTYTMGVEGTARIRTNDVTKAVQYLDEVTGNWVTKDVYTALKGSADTPIWNAEGYYYFRNADGSFSILNPYTNVKQTPDEYAAYLAAKNAVTTTPASQLQTYQTPSSDYSSYVPNLQTAYDTSVAPLAAREGGVVQTLSAWDTFTQTSDFSRIITSESDTKILVKAKNGESLTEAEISRAQFLRSQMSPEGQAAFDAATGGETAANLMSANDFENMITGNRDVVSQMSDSEIKLSGLPPEKEIVVHQVKAEENLGKFLSLDEYAGIPDESKSIIQAEIGYYAGEPSTISNLLNKFNSLKSTWTLQASQTWDKVVEALRSAKSLISEMPVWWTDQNADYTLAELVLGNNKYSNILISTTKGPSASSMPKIWVTESKKGVSLAEDGTQAVKYQFGKIPGWVVKSPDGAYSFVAANDLITTIEDAMSFAVKPIDMRFWEKPTNVRKEFQIPDDANGSQVIQTKKIDASLIPDEEWKGLTESGGLSKDKTQAVIKIDLMTPSGALWSTIRKANEAGYYSPGKIVNVIEQDAIRVAGLAGPDIQVLGADEFRAFVETNIDEFRNIPSEDLPYLTKYLDETRINEIDALISKRSESMGESTVSGIIQNVIGVKSIGEASIQDILRISEDMVTNGIDKIQIDDVFKQWASKLSPENSKTVIAELDGYLRGDWSKTEQFPKSTQDIINIIVDGWKSDILKTENMLSGPLGTPVGNVLSPTTVQVETLEELQNNVNRLTKEFKDAEDIYHSNPDAYDVSALKREQQATVERLSGELSEAENKLTTYKNSVSENVLSPGSQAASKYAKRMAEIDARRGSTEALANELSAASKKASDAKKASIENPNNKNLKIEANDAENQLKAVKLRVSANNRAGFDEIAAAKATGNNIVSGTKSIDDLLRELDALPVSDGKKTFEEVISKDKALIETIQNMDRPEAENLASQVSSKLGSDRSVAEKIMGLNYQGAANRIPNDVIAKMTKTDQELISKARIRALNQPDYQQMERILDNTKAYEGVSIGADLGRIKLNEVFDAPLTNDIKVRNLKNMLSDPDVKALLGKSNDDNLEYALKAAHDLGDNSLSSEIRRSYINELVKDIKADPKYGNLSAKTKKFVDDLPKKFVPTETDIDALTEIAEKMPRSVITRMINDFFKGTYNFIVGHPKATTLIGLSYLAGIGMAGWSMTEIYQWTVGGAAYACGGDMICLMTGMGKHVLTWNTVKDIWNYGGPHYIVQAPILGDILKFVWPAAGIFDTFAQGGTDSIMVQLEKLVSAGLWKMDGSNQGLGRALTETELNDVLKDPLKMLKAVSPANVANYLTANCNGETCVGVGGLYDGQDLTKLYYDAKMDPGLWTKLPQNFKDKFAEYDALAKRGRRTEIPGWEKYGAIITNPTKTDTGATTSGAGGATAAALSPWITGKSGSERMAAYQNPMDTSPLTQGEKQDIYNYVHPNGALDMTKAQEIFPGLSSLQLEKMFPGEVVGAIQRQISDKYGSNPEEAYKYAATMESNNQLPYGVTAGEVLPDNLKQGYQTFNNNPANFDYTAQGDQLYWTDMAGKQHYEAFDKNGKIFNPATGLYDKAQVKTEADGSQFTVDPGKLAAFYNSGGKDIDAFLKDPANYTQTWRGTGSSSSKSSGGSSGKSSGGSSYSKKSYGTGQTGIFIDAAGLGADVYENGAKIGATDVIIEVEAGVHTVTIQKSGYKSYTIPVQVYDGSIARKSVTLYTTSGTTQTNTEKFLNAIGGENSLNPYHIVYAYAISQGDNALASSAKAAASPAISGTWSFTSTEVLSLISTYGGV